MRVLLVSTLAFAVCFAAWLMFGVTGIPIRKELGLNASEFGLLTATPVLTGALFRLPLGIWTDRFGGRIVMFILLVVCALWLSSYATELWQFLLLGLALGLVGASFAVGTPYTSRFFPKEKKGLAWEYSALARPEPPSICSWRRRWWLRTGGRACPGSMPSPC
jgi:NNP family nitrate/nitrite transporter-like MFS transporter